MATFLSRITPDIVAYSFHWIVERTFAILARYRRLAKDFEALAETGETLIHIAMAHPLLKQLVPAFQPNALIGVSPQTNIHLPKNQILVYML